MMPDDIYPSPEQVSNPHLDRLAEETIYPTGQDQLGMFAPDPLIPFSNLEHIPQKHTPLRLAPTGTSL